jgi:hypothetical protein
MRRDMPALKNAIVAARDKVARAKAKIADLEAASDLTSIANAWSEFLVEFQRVFNKLEQGVKTDSALSAWYGKVKQERRLDPLLSYLQHARNTDEHGLESITGRRGPSVSAGEQGKGPMIHHIEVPEGMRVASVAFNERPLQLRPHPPMVSLAPVTDRGIRYEPPTIHLGNPMADLSPTTVARLAIDYLDGLIEKAEQLSIRA